MGENELVSVTDRVMMRIQKNQYGDIQAELSDAAVSELITSLMDIAGKVSADIYQTVSQIYTQAIISEERIQEKSMAIDAMVIKKFNDQVEKAMLQIDLKDSETVKNFNDVVATLRGNLRMELSGRRKHSLISRLFRKNNY